MSEKSELILILCWNHWKEKLFLLMVAGDRSLSGDDGSHFATWFENRDKQGNTEIRNGRGEIQACLEPLDAAVPEAIGSQDFL
jgi:hypothetical protein